MSVQGFGRSDGNLAVSNLAKTASELEAHLAFLTAFVAKAGQSWHGSEQESYNQIQANWTQAANTLHEILNSVHQGMGKTVAIVDEGRAAVTSVING